MVKVLAAKVTPFVTGLKAVDGFRPVANMTANLAPNNRVKRPSLTVEILTIEQN